MPANNPGVKKYCSFHLQLILLLYQQGYYCKNKIVVPGTSSVGSPFIKV